MYNSKGSLIRTEHHQNPTSVRMDMTGVPTGIYYLQINEAGATKALKIIKQ
ncbi:T9SS type A sorting domain-containing protein [Draconibacterium aestuarii]|uniref:T9SS type A sorting domain-containing protein n=1 Tax=Draconibacterium aestuarii TaxID=2998507 RepID=UPI003CCFF543